ncbi:hypothetical protein HA47_07275 [Pantoea stewartii subsp. indologenes]|nr:hypothetical protein HA47_07275 [Pantoea stewartii subsp. indologenes]
MMAVTQVLMMAVTQVLMMVVTRVLMMAVTRMEVPTRPRKGSQRVSGIRMLRTVFSVKPGYERCTSVNGGQATSLA